MSFLYHKLQSLLLTLAQFFKLEGKCGVNKLNGASFFLYLGFTLNLEKADGEQNPNSQKPFFCLYLVIERYIEPP